MKTKLLQAPTCNKNNHDTLVDAHYTLSRTYYIKMYISAEKMQRTQLIDCQGLLVARKIPSRICES